MFKEWKAMVDKQTGRKVKFLRLDNGGEYISRNSRSTYDGDIKADLCM